MTAPVCPVGRCPPVLHVADTRRGSLALGEGDFVVLLGPSGSGKSSWVRSLLGLGPGFDHASLFGEAVTKEQVAAHIGWVSEGDGVFLSGTVWENVAHPPHVRPCPPELAAACLGLVGLANREAEPVANLTVRARRRAALARALARQLPLLVIDGDRDPDLWRLLPRLVTELDWLRGTLAASAVAGELAWKADSVALMDTGQVVGQGAMGDLVESWDPRVRSTLAWVTPDPR